MNRKHYSNITFLGAALMLGAIASADLSGGYMGSNSDSMAFITLTQTKGKLEGTWQYVGEDRKKPNWYKASSTNVTGIVDGKKFTLKTSSGVLLQGKVLSNGIQVRIAAASGELVTLDYKSATDKVWNAAVEKFKHSRASSALAHRFGVALQNRIEWLEREKTGANNGIAIAREYLSDLEADIQEKESERIIIQTQIESAKLKLEEAERSLLKAEEEEDKANAEEIRNNTPETREAAQAARRKASEARQSYYTTRSNYEHLLADQEAVSADLESLRGRKAELESKVREAFERFEDACLVLNILGSTESAQNLKNLLNGALSASKIMTTNFVYSNPRNTVAGIIYRGREVQCLAISTGLDWVPVLLVSGKIGWIR